MHFSITFCCICCKPNYSTSWTMNRPVARSDHMVRNKLCWEASYTVRLSKQRKVGLDWYELLCFGSPTALFVSPHNLFRITWPDGAKGLLCFPCMSELYCDYIKGVDLVCVRGSFLSQSFSCLFGECRQDRLTGIKERYCSQLTIADKVEQNIMIYQMALWSIICRSRRLINNYWMMFLWYPE